MTSNSAITLLALAHPRMLATSITLPLEIIRAAAHASPPKTRSEVCIKLVGKRTETLPLAQGLAIPVTKDDAITIPDILLIPAIWRHPRWVLHHHPWQLDVIRRCVEGGSWVCSVGAGSFLLAEAGVLHEGVATTHWHWFDTFETTYPNVALRRDQLITQQGRIFCVGSVNSIADLMVYLAGQIFSRATATTCNKPMGTGANKGPRSHGPLIFKPRAQRSMGPGDQALDHPASARVQEIDST